MSIVALDTGVIAEYINLGGSLHREAEAVIWSILNGKVTAIIPHTVLAETYYVTLRIYQKLGLDDAGNRAERLIEWLYRSPNVSLAEPSLELAVLTGKIKGKYGLALTDAYVLAVARLYKGKAVFRSKEREMVANLSDLIKNYGIVFLEDDY